MKNYLKRVNTILRNKALNGSRFVLVNFFPKYLNSYLLVEYPKSGGTWLGQLISSYLEIPFPRNRFPLLKSSLIHGHFLPKKRFKYFNKIFYMVRDGRDVMVSYYYYYFFLIEKRDPNLKDLLYIKKHLKFKDYTDVKNNLPSFIDFMFTNKPPKLIRFSYEGNWRDFNEKWLEFSKNFKNNVIQVKYENLLKNTKDELKRIIKEIGIKSIDEDKIEEIFEKFSFKNQTGRKPGEENPKSFLRKGVAGDWKNKFSKKAAEIFNYYAGDLLIKLGYEKDKGWLKKVKV